MAIDLLFGKFRQMESRSATFVCRLDFVYWSISESRCNDIINQWNTSDRHYDYIVCDGKPDELLVFANDWDAEKYRFYTFGVPKARYRLASPEENEAHNPDQSATESNRNVEKY